MIITVTQLNNYLKGVIDMDSVLSQIEVQGEVTNLRQTASYVYFSLKDESSQIDCFSYSDNNLQLVQGSIVLAYGNINFLNKSGRISFFVRRVQNTDNKGQSYLQFLALKDKLDKEGLFDLSRKKIVPSACKRIGVVTSKTGAVIKDIQSVVWRRQPFSDIFLYDVRVQGNTAVNDIVEAIKYFNTADVDVVIVARGGGSDEDLSVFNDEKVIRAVAQCNKPTVSAIGHGIDFTLTDYVADRRAVTPTEAGEITTLDSREIQRKIQYVIYKDFNYLQSKVNLTYRSVSSSLSAIKAVYSTKLVRLQTNVIQQLRLSQSTIDRKILKNELSLKALTDRISYVNPMSRLQKGYAVVQHNCKRIVSVSQLSCGDKMTVNFYDGTADVTVDSIVNADKKAGIKK